MAQLRGLDAKFAVGYEPNCPDFETEYLKFMPLSTGPRYPYAVEHSGSSAGKGDGGYGALHIPTAHGAIL